MILITKYKKSLRAFHNIIYEEEKAAGSNTPILWGAGGGGGAETRFTESKPSPSASVVIQTANVI